MTEVATLVLSNHRRQLRIAFGASFVAVLLSMAPSHGRALFVVQDPGVAAFSAILPPEPVVPNLGRYLVTVLEPFRGRGLVRRVGYVGRPLVPANPYGPAGPDDAGVPTEPDSPYSDPVNTAPLIAAANPSPLTLGDPLGFLPAPPFAFGPPGTSPVGALQQLLTEAIPAVPEPMTWTTMIFGFFGVGAMLRRHRLFEANAIMPESHCVKT